MWRIIIRFVEIVSNSNRRIRTKDMCGFWIKKNGGNRNTSVSLYEPTIKKGIKISTEVSTGVCGGRTMSLYFVIPLLLLEPLPLSGLS